MTVSWSGPAGTKLDIIRVRHKTHQERTNQVGCAQKGMGKAKLDRLYIVIADLFKHLLPVADEKRPFDIEINVHRQHFGNPIIQKERIGDFYKQKQFISPLLHQNTTRKQTKGVREMRKQKKYEIRRGSIRHIFYRKSSRNDYV